MESNMFSDVKQEKVQEPIPPHTHTQKEQKQADLSDCPNAPAKQNFQTKMHRLGKANRAL